MELTMRKSQTCPRSFWAEARESQMKSYISRSNFPQKEEGKKEEGRFLRPWRERGKGGPTDPVKASAFFLLIFFLLSESEHSYATPIGRMPAQ
jgi:hypothetical protein